MIDIKEIYDDDDNLVGYHINGEPVSQIDISDLDTTIVDNLESFWKAIVKHNASHSYLSDIPNPRFNDRDKVVEQFFYSLGQAVFNDFLIDSVQNQYNEAEDNEIEDTK